MPFYALNILKLKGYFEYKIHILCEKRPFYGLSSRDASQKSYFVWSTLAWLENISASVGSVRWTRYKRNAIPPFQAIPMVFHFAGCWRADGGQNSKGALPTMIWEVLWMASDVLPILGVEVRGVSYSSHTCLTQIFWEFGLGMAESVQHKFGTIVEDRSCFRSMDGEVMGSSAQYWSFPGKSL